jgi:glycosyltransferase involved in cell wall biosynthesis
MKKNKVILSTFGPLHLIKSAEYLSSYVDIKVIQGWIPTKYDRFLIKIASKLVGRDLSKSFNKRTPEVLNNRNFSCAFGEFYLWTMRVLSKYFKFIDKSKISLHAANIYGWQSKRLIKDANIFHVRSGSGFAGAIEKAKANGMKVLVDHSIAHPAFMDNQLRSEFVKHKQNFELGMDSRFWQGVLTDCSKADCLLVNSDFVKDTFIETGYPDDRIQVVYLGVRDDFFILKSNYKIIGKIKILFTGSFGFRKGAEYLLQALIELDNLNFAYEMTVVGSFEEATELLSKYQPKNIYFTGHIPQDELKKYLAESDIYLFPSLCEGCASSAMEAMAAGLPVITTLEAGLPIETGKNGIIVPSKNVDKIVETIVQLSQNENLRTHLGQFASSTISNNYTWDKYANKVSEIYSALLKK